MTTTSPFTPATRYRLDPTAETADRWDGSCLAPGCPRRSRHQQYGLCAICWREEDRRARAIIEASGDDIMLLRQANRSRPFCYRRTALMAVVRGATRLSLDAIGRLFDRDHSTVAQAVNACGDHNHPARARFRAYWAVFDDAGLLRRDTRTADIEATP